MSVINNISLAWTGDFESLKQFTAHVLKLDGDWTQPGGDKKVFASGDITLIWRKTKYLLSVDGRKSVEVKKRICEEMFRDNPKSASPLSIQEAQEGVTAGTCMEEIERLKEGQLTNTELIQTLADSISECADVISKLQESRVSSSIQDPCFKSRISDDNDSQNANSTLVNGSVVLGELPGLLTNNINNRYANSTKINGSGVLDELFDPPTKKNVYFPPGKKNILSDNDNRAFYVALDELRGDAGQSRCNSKKKLTYAEVLKSNNANISSQLISKSSDNPKENCDEMLSNTSTDGFVGVQRKRKKFKSFFVSGISELVKEKQISSYLSRRNVIPSHISVFPSKRKGIISAKIGIPIASVSKVQEKTFWPMYVYCKPWRQNDKRKPVVQRINNMPQKEEYATYV